MSEPPIQIPVEKLREVFELLMGHLAQVSGPLVKVSKDAFWSVPAAAAYDVCSEPKELTIGMISESSSHLEEMVEDKASVVGYGLVWLAEALRAIGDDTAP